jgi:hypothetical protein
LAFPFICFHFPANTSLFISILLRACAQMSPMQNGCQPSPHRLLRQLLPSVASHAPPHHGAEGQTPVTAIGNAALLRDETSGSRANR